MAENPTVSIGTICAITGLSSVKVPMLAISLGIMAFLGCRGRESFSGKNDVRSDVDRSAARDDALRLSPSDQRGLQWQIEYDERGLVTHVRYPSGETAQLSYDQDEHGHLARLAKQTSDNREVVLYFDGNGRRTRMTDSLGEVQYEHDRRGRLSRMRREGVSELSFDYDARDRPISMKLGSELEISVTYDFLSGQPERMETPTGSITYESRLDEATVIRTLPNGIVTKWQFQPDDRLKSITHVRGDDVLIQFEYTYRPDGLLNTVREVSAEGERSTTYQYDLVHRLIAVDDSREGKTAYEYDPLGNRTKWITSTGKELVSSYSKTGQLLAYDGQPCGHDGNGNLVDFQRRTDPVAIGYTVEGRLESVEANSGTVDYVHDGDGNLVARTIAGRTTKFAPDPHSATWRPLTSIDEMGGTTHFLWEGESPIGTIKSGQALYFLTDHLGSVRFVTNSDGDIVDERTYCPFGTSSQIEESYELMPGFCGLFYDSIAGLYLTRARGYDPVLGRFTAPDPRHRLPTASQRDLPISYAYCGNDPVNYLDLDGEQPVNAAVQQQALSQRVSAPNVARNAPYQPQPHFEWALGTGWTSGVQSVESLLRTGAGRFEVIYVTGSPLGIAGDFLTIPMAEMARSFLMRTPFSAKYAVMHSGATSTTIPGVRDYIYVGSSRLGGVPYRDVITNRRDPVPNISALHPILRREADGKYFGLEVMVRFQGLRDLGRAVPEVIREAVRGTRGVGPSVFELAKAASNSILGTKFSTFAAHDLGKYLDNLGSRIPSVGTFRQVQVVYPDGTTYLGVYRNGAWESRALDRLVAPQTATALSPFYFPPTHYSPTNLPPSLSLIDRNDLSRNRLTPSQIAAWEVIGNASKNVVQGPIGGGQGDSDGQHDGPREHGIPDESSDTPQPAGGGDASGAEGIELPGNQTPENSPGPTRNSMVPSSLGGVYLGGAARAFEDFGPIQGIAFLEGKLVLVGEESPSMPLPALRLEDVAAIFRDVYQHGESAWLTIDPDPKAPSSSSDMIVRFGPGRAGYYLWVLFMCDRIMKDFSLGRDHRSAGPMRTNVSGYQSVLDRRMEQGNVSSGPEGWVRYWIVPSGVTRQVSTHGEMTLLEIPLELRTQAMTLRGGKLIPAANDRAPASSVAFARWFTDQYDDLAREVFVMPPEGSGHDGPVPIFAELKRIATIAAAAEAMRDQHMPLLDWMRNYPLSDCPIPSHTPALTAVTERQHGRRIVRMRSYGGVTLSVPDEDISVRASSPNADGLLDSVRRAIVSGVTMTPVTFTHEQARFRAVALPASNARALGACQLVENDLSVPVEGTKELRLTRHFHSFFRPSGEFGQSWTLDLPYLAEEHQPVRRTAESVEYRIVHRLGSPLGTSNETFAERRFVTELNSHLPAPQSDVSPYLGLADGWLELLQRDTTVVHLRDGRRWHFDEKGDLVGEEAPLCTILYRRDNDGRLRIIEGYWRDEKRAAIVLDYDLAGRIVTARTSRGDRVEYDFDQQQLVNVRHNRLPTTKYQYQGGQVSGISRDGRVVQRFQYTSEGELTVEARADGTRTTWDFGEAPKGTRMTVRHHMGEQMLVEQITQFDADLQVISHDFTGGTRIDVLPPTSGMERFSLSTANGDRFEFATSVDGRLDTCRLPSGESYQMELDDAGRVTRVLAEDRSVLRQEWRKDGRLARLADDTTDVQFGYAASGLLKGIMLCPVQVGVDSLRQIKILWDPLGRQTKVLGLTDELATVLQDDQGREVGWKTRHGHRTWHYDHGNRFAAMDTSWGQRITCSYDEVSHLPRTMEVQEGESHAVAEYTLGRLVRWRHFDGGEYKVDYADEFGDEEQVRTIAMPNGLNLDYEYDSVGNLNRVTCGNAFRMEYEFDEEGRVVRIAQVPVE